MTSIPMGNSCVNSDGVMALVSTGRRVSHPRVAVRGRRIGCRSRSRRNLCVVAACASESISNHVYDVTEWPDAKNTSISVAIPPQSSTRCSGLLGSMSSGMFGRDGDDVRVLGTILGGRSE